MKRLTAHPRHPLPWLHGKDKTWGEFYRVRLPSPALETQKLHWCRENVAKDRWGRSDGSEVFYFAAVEDAVAFKLRWEGADK